ncbi:MAG: glycosyl hydrolase family 25 [Paludibacteraceae bacterium]|nr:glycosyl hydrolase family 25 [Paludibacteraceae bacterium]
MKKIIFTILLIVCLLASFAFVKKGEKETSTNVIEKTSVSCSSYNGIDVSHYQGTIDWEKVAENKQIQFVYLKATEGKTYVDRTYAYNLRQARKFGLKVGSYHYFRMTSSPKQQFENFKKTAPKEKQDLIPMIDVETGDKKSKAEVQKALKEFVKLLTDYYGTEPMFYGTMRSCNTWLAPEFNNYKYYVGRYGNNQPQINGKNGKYIIWQYSEKGSIKGIPKYVDLCRFAKCVSIDDIALKK